MEETSLHPVPENLFRNLQILVDKISEPSTQTFILDKDHLAHELSAIVDMLILLHYKVSMFDPQGSHWVNK